MEYWKSYTDANGNIYSIDKIKINLEFSKKYITDLLDYFNNINRLDIISYKPNFKEFNYKHFYSIDYGTSKMVVAIGLNGYNADDSMRGYVMFNPNKVCGNPQFTTDLGAILSACWKKSLVSFDLAIDIPTPRENVFLVKDKRKYCLIGNSSADKTEYLGERSQSGRVKLYNKTKESKLDYDLTRLEVTLDNFKDLNKQLSKWFPEVYSRNFQIQNFDKNLTSEKLSNTQQVLALLISLQDNPDYYLKMIDNKNIRNKIKNAVLENDKQIVCSRTIVQKFKYDLEELLPNVELE